MKKPLQIGVALVLTGLLLYFFVDIREVGRVLAGVDPWWALLTILVITGDRLLMSFKWTLLLRVRGYHVPIIQALMVYCSSMVWGLALPSTVGADAIRAGLIRRQGVEYHDSVATIIMERGVGFVSALGMGLLSLLTMRFVLPGAHDYDAFLLIGAAAMLVALVVLALSFTQRAFDWFLAMLPQRWQHAKVVETLARLHDTYRSLATNPRTLAWFTVLTGVQQMYLVVVSWMIALSLGLEADALYFLAAAPLAFLAARLPISFDGIGIYEAIFVAVMSMSGLTPAESFAIAVTGRVYNLITWLPWFLAFLFRGGMAASTELCAPRAARRPRSERPSIVTVRNRARPRRSKSGMEEEPAKGVAARPRCVVILSTKSAGSSALQHFLCRFAGARFLEHSRHTGRTTVETLYWTKAASVLGLPQVRLPDSEVPIPPRKALDDLHSLLRDNVPGFVIPAEPRQLVMEGWRALCRRHAPAFVEKSPHHLHQWSVLELLQQATLELDDIDFRFIGLVRNPMDVLYSAWKRWRTRPDVLQHHWQMAYDNLRRWQSIAGDRLMCLRYEDFSGAPGTATRLMQFLDVPAAPGAEDFIHGKSKQRWRTDPWFRFRLDPEVEAAARAWGYAPEEIYNEPAATWTPYSLVTRTAHRLWRIPQQKARRTYRLVRRAFGNPGIAG